MKLKIFLFYITLVSALFACGDSNDYRDVYVGTYNGNGYSGEIVVESTGASKSITSQNSAINVSKDKSSVHRINIQIDNDVYSATIDGSALTIDQREFETADENTHYTYKVYQVGSGSITANTINLAFTYSGIATYEPDPNDQSQTRTYDISGSGSAAGIK